MVSGFALPLYLVISIIGVMALTLMLPKPFYVPAVKLCVFTKTNALARTVINTTAGAPCTPRHIMPPLLPRTPASSRPAWYADSLILARKLVLTQVRMLMQR